MRILSYAAALLLSATSHAQADTQVDVELMLAVDVSYSMSEGELEIQRRGYASALNDPAIWDAISLGRLQRVAITFVEWAGSGRERIVVPWTLVDAPDDLARIAAELIARPPSVMLRTSISSVLDYAPLSFETNGFEGERRIIDVSGDGPNNMGRPVTDARDALLAQGYEINGLPLMTRDGRGMLPDLEDLDLYYEHCVVGGPLSFVIPVHSWEEFPPAVRQKLVLELAGRRPEPATTPEAVPAQWRAETEDGFDCLIGERIWRTYMGRE